MPVIKPFIKATLVATLLIFSTLAFSQRASKKQTTKFAALAIDRNNGLYYGWAIDQKSAVDAEQKAIQECNNKGGNGTVVLEWSGRGCAAYRTVKGTVGTAYGWGLAPTKKEADAIATRECLKRSKGIAADNFVGVCNSGAANSLKELLNEPAKPVKSNPAATNELKSYINFNGNKVAATGSCPDTTVAVLTAGDETLMVLFNNLPADGTTEVNANFLTTQCTTCFAISVQDINASVTYIATGGTFTKKGNDINFTIMVQEMSNLMEGFGTSFPVSGKFTCEE